MAKPADLTGPQWDAVEHFEGPLLVLAGPGSGKTRVITRRIARLVERGVDPRQLLAITFTNKAATEMADRVGTLLPGTRVWVSTFHKFCAYQLRRHADLVGLKPNFTILDQSDQTSFLKEILKGLGDDCSWVPPGVIAAHISRAKNKMLLPDDLRPTGVEGWAEPTEALVSKAYAAYQKALLQANCVDFDDLLLHMAILLREQSELRARLDYRYQFILVDEFQDTNLVQYHIVRMLSQDYQNLCATGDPDQSIYGWRGAEIRNILQFESDFPATKLVRLEHNYRSTRSILSCADRLIRFNRQRKHKDLITDNKQGEPVRYWEFESADEEADGLARYMLQRIDEGTHVWSDFALLFRVNHLSRRLERACVRYRIPYQIASGVAFYERAEVKDLLAYLRVIVNPFDISAFRRIVNTPVRGIGKQTQNKLIRHAEVMGIDLLDACRDADRIVGLGKRGAYSAKMFARMMSEFSLSDTGSVEGLIHRIVDRTRYAYGWDDPRASEEDLQRLGNIQELIAAAAAFDHSVNGESTLEGFLEESTLVADLDNLDSSAGMVSLMTMHSAKGLEFSVVVIVGLEENLLPHERALKDNSTVAIEEERRLLFVGMTRAKDGLILTRACQRDVRGRLETTIPSLFLRELALDPTHEPISLPQTANSKVDDSASLLEKHKARLRDLQAQQNSHRPPMLMTAASLLSGSREAVPIPSPFEIGMRVRHPQHGYGQVTETGTGTRRTVTVQFESGLTETYIAQKSPLQPVGNR